MELHAEPRAGVQACGCADVQTFVGRSIAETFVGAVVWAIDRLIVWAFVRTFVRAIVEPS